MTRLLIAAGLVAVAVAVAFVLRRRQRTDAPTQPRRFPVPAQLDRRDFAAPERPWLVAVFTSATCDACAATLTKARALAGPNVAVVDVEVGAQRALHQRYGIEAVPLVVIADRDGVVRGSYVGPPGGDELAETLQSLLGTGAGGG